MQLAPQGDMTDRPRKLSMFAEDSGVGNIKPPYVFKPNSAALAIPLPIIPTIHPDPSDEERAEALERYNEERRLDKERYNAWLEAFTEFNTDYQPKGYLLQGHVKSRKLKDGRIVKLSGEPPVALPRIEEQKEKRPNGSVRHRKVRLNRVHAVFLEEGDFWGPHSGDQYPPATKLHYLERQAASKESRAVSKERQRLELVLDKGPYTGMRWTEPRPPTLTELWVQHFKQLQHFPLVWAIWENTAVTKSGTPYFLEKMVKIRNGAALGNPWVAECNPGDPMDVGLYATPLTPLQDKLETGTELVSFTTISTDTDVREVTRLGKASLGGLEILPEPLGETLVEKDSKKVTSSWKYWLYPKGAYSARSRYLVWLEERNVHNATDWASVGTWRGGKLAKTVLLADGIHRTVSSPLFVVERLGEKYKLSKTEIIGRRVLRYGSMQALILEGDHWYWNKSDEARYDLWHHKFGSLELARSRSCVHRSKGLTILAENREDFVGPIKPSIPLPELAHINLLDRPAMQDIRNDEPLSAEELEDWMDHVATYFQGSASEKFTSEVGLRLGILSPEETKALVGGYRKTRSGLYVPTDNASTPKETIYLEIKGTPDDPERMSGQIIQPEIWQEYAAEIRQRIQQEHKDSESLIDRIVKGLKWLQ